MWLFESDIDTEGIKQYKKDIEKIHIKYIVEDMAMDYLNNSATERYLIKYRIENILNTCEETKSMSILLTLAIFIIEILIKEIGGKIFYQNNKWFIFALFSIIYFIVMGYIACSYKYFKVCKLYLKVINDIEQGNIKLKIDSNNNKYIAINLNNVKL